MKTSQTFLISAALCLTALPMEVSAQDEAGQSSLLGTSRILMSCDADPVSLITPTMDWAGFAERDLVVLKFKDGQINLLSKTGQPTSFSDARLKKMGRALYCGSGADFLLIGKDGGPKRRWRKTVPLQELFDTIDSMPMRQYEMRKTGGRYRISPGEGQ